MAEYRIFFEVWYSEINEFQQESLQFYGDSKLHVINQLLDFQRTMAGRVSCINKVEKL